MEPMTTLGDVIVRSAGRRDVEALVELRALMFTAMGMPGVEGEGWRRSAAEWFISRLASPAVHVVVVEVDGVVVAAAMGTHRDSAPSPGSLGFGDVLVSNVVVRPEYRRQGYARRVLSVVLEWAAGLGVSRIELVATGEGRRLYEEVGFRDSSHPLMRMPLASSR